MYSWKSSIGTMFNMCTRAQARWKTTYMTLRNLFGFIKTVVLLVTFTLGKSHIWSRLGKAQVDRIQKKIRRDFFRTLRFDQLDALSSICFGGTYVTEGILRRAFQRHPTRVKPLGKRDFLIPLGTLTEERSLIKKLALRTADGDSQNKRQADRNAVCSLSTTLSLSRYTNTQQNSFPYQGLQRTHVIDASVIGREHAFYTIVCHAVQIFVRCVEGSPLEQQLHNTVAI